MTEHAGQSFRRTSHTIYRHIIIIVVVVVHTHERTRVTLAPSTLRDYRVAVVHMLPAILLLFAMLASVAAASPSSDECVLDLAVVCLDDKLLVYVHWLEKRDKLNVVGDIVTIVKKRPVGRLEDRSKLQHSDQRVQASESLGPAIDEYFGTHTLRISLPWILDDDIELELDQQGRFGIMYSYYKSGGK